MNYSIEHVLSLIIKYIYQKRNIIVSINLNLDNPEELLLFEKAATIVLDYYERR